MTAAIIDGRVFAATVRARVARHVADLKARHTIRPPSATSAHDNRLPARQVIIASDRANGLAEPEGLTV